MTRKLTAHVHIGDRWYRPGDSPPDDVAARITNPDVWDGPAPEVQSGIASPPDPSKQTDGPKVTQPPRKGPGSGGPAWIEFAKAHGVTETFDSKDALISELETRGLIEKE